MLTCVELLCSKLLHSVHGFSTREGGVSQGAFSSLNTSRTVGDDAAAVEENLRRLTQRAQAIELLTVSQVHGVEVVEDQALVNADAVMTARPHVAVGVRTADCLPVLLEDPKTGRVAAVHAGWRGVIGGIAPKTVRLLAERGADPGRLRVALGPAIQKCCFEVDGDLPERFVAAFGRAVLVSGFAKPHLDLAQAVRQSLEQAGVAPANIDVLPHCTHCDARFFSHRRDCGVTGRHLSFITSPGPQ